MAEQALVKVALDLRYEDAWHAAVEDDLERIPTDLMVKHYANIMQIKRDYQHAEWSRSVTTGVWIIGPGWSHIYKPTERPSSFPQQSIIFNKSLDKWWDGYNGHERVLLYGLGLSDHQLGAYLVMWAGRHAFVGERRKQALSELIRPELIVVVSNYSIHEIWGDGEIRDAMLRRFKVRRNVGK